MLTARDHKIGWNLPGPDSSGPGTRRSRGVTMSIESSRDVMTKYWDSAHPIPA